MASSSPRPAWVSHRGEVRLTLEQLPIMLQHPQQNQFKIKTWLQHRRTMTSTWQNNVCNTSINFKKNIATTSQKSNCNITKNMVET
jgi:hypothetical protein